MKNRGQRLAPIGTRHTQLVFATESQTFRLLGVVETRARVIVLGPIFAKPVSKAFVRHPDMRHAQYIRTLGVQSYQTISAKNEDRYSESPCTVYGTNLSSLPLAMRFQKCSEHILSLFHLSFYAHFSRNHCTDTHDNSR